MDSDWRTGVEEMADAAFAGVLGALGFTKARVRRATASTTISYTGPEIGVDIELDWRELDVFVLLVRLENGKLPGGYYMHEGKTVRAHLHTVLGLPPVRARRRKREGAMFKGPAEAAESLKRSMQQDVALLETRGASLVETAKAYFQR